MGGGNGNRDGHLGRKGEANAQILQKRFCGRIHRASIMAFLSRSFCYNVDEMPWELNSCLYQLAYSKIGFVIYILLLKVPEPIDDVERGRIVPPVSE